MCVFFFFHTSLSRELMMVVNRNIICSRIRRFWQRLKSREGPYLDVDTLVRFLLYERATKKKRQNVGLYSFMGLYY
jgi:hypothetical protein